MGGETRFFGLVLGCGGFGAWVAATDMVGDAREDLWDCCLLQYCYLALL